MTVLHIVLVHYLVNTKAEVYISWLVLYSFLLMKKTAVELIN